MKLLFESWRQYLKEDVSADIHPKIRIMIDRLLKFPDLGVAIETGDKSSVEVYYINIETNERYHTPEGSVSIDLDREYDGQCLGGYVVSNTGATSGWGPLLYEVALEWASQNASGLAPDRHSVSSDAAAVWDIYSQREAPVEKRQLDIDIEKSSKGQSGRAYRFALQSGYIPQLTPHDPADDCVQISTFKHADDKYGRTGSTNRKWADNPLSKLYYKATQEVTDFLESPETARLVRI
tara:strand:- start:662 stop:1372 length:711 start_codon:yes stop_codon:yes gene_type:complete